MASPDVIEIVKDLMAITIVSDIDDYFASATGNCLVKKLCEDSEYESLFTIETTTSKDAINNHGKIANRPLPECPIHNEVIKNMKKYAKEAKIEWSEKVEKEFRLNRPKFIRIDFYKGRSCQNKCLLIIYRVIRFFNVTIWTYFLPTFALIVQFAYPLYTDMKKHEHHTKKIELIEADMGVHLHD